MYDPDHDEAIVTFTSSHTLAVFDMAAGRLKKLIHTDQLGLTYPRGLAMAADGRSYGVSGSWRDLHFFERGTHRHRPDATIFEIFYHHSHLTVV